MHLLYFYKDVIPIYRAESKDLLTQELLLQGAEIFGIDPLSLALVVGGFENIIYAGELKDRLVILRITNHRHRTKEQLDTELHWLEYLQEHGANVCGPFKSQAGNLVESLAVEGAWLHFSCFAKAPGRHIKTREELHNIQLFHSWGKATSSVKSLVLWINCRCASIEMLLSLTKSVSIRLSCEWILAMAEAAWQYWFRLPSVRVA